MSHHEGIGIAHDEDKYSIEKVLLFLPDSSLLKVLTYNAVAYQPQ